MPLQGCSPSSLEGHGGHFEVPNNLRKTSVSSIFQKAHRSTQGTAGWSGSLCSLENHSVSLLRVHFGACEGEAGD